MNRLFVLLIFGFLLSARPIFAQTEKSHPAPPLFTSGQPSAGNSSTPADKLEAAVKNGVLRHATKFDAVSWENALKQKYARKKQPPPDIPADLNNAYVVLKRFTYPKGLEHGYESVFYVPRGVPLPDGDYGQSKIYDLNSVTLECRGDTTCGEDILHGVIGPTAKTTITMSDGGKIIIDNSAATQTSASIQTKPVLVPQKKTASVGLAGERGSLSMSLGKVSYPDGDEANNQKVELHLIELYEGPKHYGGRSIDDPAESVVNVYVKSRKPVILVLSNYESVTWNVVPLGSASVKEILLSSYNNSVVLGIDGSVTKISRTSWGGAYSSVGAGSLVAKAKQHTGLLVNSVTTQYKGGTFYIGN